MLKTNIDNLTGKLAVHLGLKRDRMENECTVSTVPPVVPYKVLEKFSKALYGTTGDTYNALIFHPVMKTWREMAETKVLPYPSTFQLGLQ